MKRIFVLLFIFSSAVCVFPIPLENLVSADYAARLRNTERGRIIETQLKDPVPRLTPNHSVIRQNVTWLMNTLNPNMLVENLYLYLKPERSKTDSGSWDSGQKIKIFNQITAVNSLTGIQYYSSSRKEMRIFYEYSSVIDGPVTQKPLPDPVFMRLPASLTIFARQKDLTFGDNIYRYNYVNTVDAVFFNQENITSLSYGIIPVIGRGNLRSVMAIIDCGDAILIYAALMAKTASAPGLSDKISASFNNRAQAVLSWFIDRLDKGL